MHLIIGTTLEIHYSLETTSDAKDKQHLKVLVLSADQQYGFQFNDIIQSILSHIIKTHGNYQ